MTTLLRIVELTSGTISIDDIDIAKLGLDDLRQAIAIIPQEAVRALCCVECPCSVCCVVTFQRHDTNKLGPLRCL